MRLDQRLRLLRGERAQAAPAPGNLAQRLHRLAPIARRQELRQVADASALADFLKAERLAPGVLRVVRRFALEEPHGRAKPSDCLSSLPDLMDEPAGQPNTWLFLDTETSGLAGGTGTWAFLCGLLRFDGHGLLLRQYLLARLDAEHAYLEAIGEEFQSAGLLITYNGKSFDAPLLITRLRLAGLSTTLEGKGHLDLLHPMRRAFARVWPDCRLVTAEQRLLGFARQGDLTGGEAPAAWLAWLRRGEVEPLAGVLRHNCWDLLSLPALTLPLSRSFVDPASTGADAHSVARFHLARGDTGLAFELLCANRDGLGPAALMELARMHRRRGDWSAAGTIWERLAEQGVPEALEAQAKFLEHRKRDYAKALEWTSRLPVGHDRERRRRRLEGKLRAQAAGPSQAIMSTQG